MDNEMIRKQFEEWANTQGFDLEYGVKEAAWLAWQAATDKLRDAVIILEDGAEPEVGDLIYKYYPLSEGGGMNHWYVVGGDNFTGDLQCGLSFAKKCVKENGFEIIRNGKPCIYRSALADKGEVQTYPSWAEPVAIIPKQDKP